MQRVSPTAAATALALSLILGACTGRTIEDAVGDAEETPEPQEAEEIVSPRPEVDLPDSSTEDGVPAGDDIGTEDGEE